MGDVANRILNNRHSERITILLKHGEGLLSQLYNTKKMVASKADKLEILGEKQFESQVKSAVKKFPQCDSLLVNEGFVSLRREFLTGALYPHYLVMVDVMEFQDQFKDLIGSMSSDQLYLNINVNYSLTESFLNLMQVYMSLMILLFRFEERKTIALVVNAVHNLVKGGHEPLFGRLSQMLLEQDMPLKTFHHIFRPHGALFVSPLRSLLPLFNVSYLSAKDLRKQNTLNLTQNIQTLAEFDKIANVNQFTAPLDKLIHWIVFGYCLIPDALHADEDRAAVITCLTDGFVLNLYRTETILVHSMFEKTLSTMKEPKKFAKIKTTLLDQVNAAIGNAPSFHAERRLYLRQTLSQMHSLLKDKPSLIAPKIGQLVKALGMAKDEVNWLLRHATAPVPKAKTKLNPRVFNDKHMSELLFYICEMCALVRTNYSTMRKYFAEFLGGNIATAINENSAPLHLTNHEHAIIDGFIETFGGFSADSAMSFDGYRLDWMRLQCSMSFGKAPHPLPQHKVFAEYLNLGHFISKFMDDLDETLVRIAMPSMFSFYQTALQKYFTQCVDSPGHQRYCIAFVQICDSFSFNATAYLPEERISLGKQATNLADQFLSKIAYKANLVANEMAMQHVELGKELLPSEAVKGGQTGKKKGHKHAKAPSRDKAKLANLEALQLTIADLCWALNHHVTVDVFNCTYSPREYLVDQLAQMVPAVLARFSQNEGNAPQRPSTALNSIQSYMASYRSLESYINIEISSLFSRVLLQQTSIDDSNGGTIAKSYTDFIVAMIFKSGYNGGVLYSSGQHCLVGTHEGVDVQTFTSITELKALCQLIGPFGVKNLCEQIVSRVATMLKNLKQVTAGNQRIGELTKNLHSRDGTNEVLKSIRDTDAFFKFAAGAGLALNFRRLLLTALQSVLEERIPFIFTSINDLHKHVRGSESVDTLALTAGLTSDLDPVLNKFFREYVGGDAQIIVHLNVFFGVCLRYIATLPSNTYNTLTGTHEGNAQCVARTIVDISSALVALSCQNPATVRQQIVFAQKEILRVASVLLLRLMFNAKEPARNRNAALVIMYQIINESPFLTADVLEEFMPYSLIRCAHHALLKDAKQSVLEGEEPIVA
eukprot:m.145264 g.145264  ORF g.145264 m.145264 type:complete len:1108 (+) comp13229_c0_seq4:80-3403(+)